MYQNNLMLDVTQRCDLISARILLCTTSAYRKLRTDETTPNYVDQEFN